ncbi:hypothetical protein [Halomontanus rarus]|uniref:hypothetical protein n=1 Tax=Halomontanus rarus TaxID=3034020 RepID=UPI001A9A08E8
MIDRENALFGSSLVVLGDVFINSADLVFALSGSLLPALSLLSGQLGAELAFIDQDRMTTALVVVGGLVVLNQLVKSAETVIDYVKR